MRHTAGVIFLGALALTLSVAAGASIHAAKNANLVEAADSSALSSYYGSAVDWTATGATLKTALHNKIESHTAGSYGGLWEIYKTSDIDSNGKIWDIYSNYRFTVTADQCGTYSVEGDCYNREHLIPQSIFSEASPMVCDAHHIYPTDGKVNGMRSNYPHGFVSSATYTSGNGSKLGNGNSTYGYTSTCFEPVNDYKGDVARAYFYFVTAYQENISSYSYASFSQDTYPSLATWAIKTYLKWAYDDPVSAKEIARNDAIYAAQGNRNPYVDHPEAAARVWDPNNTYGYFNTYGSGSTTPSVTMPSTATVDVGSTVSVTASKANTTAAISYSSNNTSVATVDTSGTVTGVAAGTATITASLTDNGTTYSDTCLVTVTAVTPTLTLGQTSISLTVGGTAGSVSYTNTHFTGTPTVTITTAPSSSIATASLTSGTTGTIAITPVAAGSTSLTVTSTYGTESATATLAITVEEASSNTVITASSTNVPSTYSTSTTALSIEGLSIIAYNVGTSYTSGYIQFKGSSGYMSNTVATSANISSIVIVYKSSVTSSPTTVSFGSSSSSLSSVTGSGSGTTWTYTPSSSATFFKILCGSSAGYVASITINYGASTAKTLSSLALTTAPSKTSYYVGDTLSTTGAVVTATYSDSTTADVTSSVTWSPSTLSSSGSQTITGSYTYGSVTKTVTYSVTVTAVALTSIAVTTQPTKTTYQTNDTFDSTGLVVTGTYNNSTTAAVTGYTLSSPDMTTEGTKTVTVTYSGLTTTFTITVNAASGSATLTGISVTTQPTKATYTVGDTLDTTGLVVTGSYNDGTTADVTSSCTLSPANGSALSTVGTTTVTVSNGSYTDTFSVTVNAASGSSTTYTLITSTSGLVSGAKYIIASADSTSGYAMSSTQNSNNRGKEAVTISSDLKITATDTIEQLTLGGDATNGWSLYANKSSTQGYLYAASSSSNYLRTQTTNDSNGLWTIAISTNAATITAKGSNTHKILKWNSDSSIFSCYASGQAAVYLYRQDTSDSSSTDAKAFAQTFNTSLSGVCNANGNSTLSSIQSAWQSQATAYAALSSGAKALLTAASPTDSDIIAFAAKYSYIYTKYGSSSFASYGGDFLNKYSSAYAGATESPLSSSTSILFVTAIFLAVGALGLYVVKRRKQRD
jgi:endonuclease I